MAEIHLPHASWFSYASVPPVYQHQGLAQQVLAHKATKLSKELECLVAEYEGFVQDIQSVHEQYLALTRKINKLSPSSRLKTKFLAEQQALKATLKSREKELFSSKITLKISSLRANLKSISRQLGLSV